MSLFGIYDWADRMPSILRSTVAVFLTCRIGLILFNKHIGWLACMMHASNGFMIKISGGRIATNPTDVPFIFFLMKAMMMWNEGI